MEYTYITNEYKGDWSKYQTDGIYTCVITTKTYYPNGSTKIEVKKIVSDGLNNTKQIKRNRALNKILE